MEGNAKFSHGVNTKEDVISSYPRAQAPPKVGGQVQNFCYGSYVRSVKKNPNKNKLNTGQYRVLSFFWGTFLCIAQTVRMLLINRKISPQAGTEEQRLVF